MTMTSHRRLPLTPHPIVSAFFDAHDDELESKKVGAARNSTVVRMRSSLGWRTRHCSSALYPVSVLPVEGRRRSGERNRRASFHVRQVFPRHSVHRGKARDIINGADPHEDDDASGKQPITVNEEECEFGTGATVWPGSIVLMKYLEMMAHDPRQTNVLEGKTVADLGSGTAITSIASALLGANLVVCTDGCDPVVDLARHNIRDAILLLGSVERESSPKSAVDNVKDILSPDEPLCDFRFLGCKMIARKYRWGEGTLMEDIPWDWDGTYDQNPIRNNQHARRLKKKTIRNFDVILGADCIVPKLYPIEPLVDAIDELSGDRTVSYLSYEQRHYSKFDPAAEFRRLARARSLEVEVVPNREMHPMYPANDIQVWKVTRGDTPGAGVKRTKKRNDKVCFVRASDRSNHQSLLVGAYS